MNKELIEIIKYTNKLNNHDYISMGDELNYDASLRSLKSTLEVFDIIKKFNNYEVIEVQGQWYLLQGNSFFKSPKIPVTEEQAILIREVLK